MKNYKHSFLLLPRNPAQLFTILILLLSFQLVTITSIAQYTKLHDFNIVPDGRNPHGSLISDGTFLYGMTYQGGLNNLGTVFKMMPDGTAYTKLLEFGGAANGSHPWGSLFFDGSFLYGMTEDGGTNNLGVIFKVMPDGTGFVKLFDFVTSSNGYSPRGGLISDGTFLYGISGNGGTNNVGTIFKIKFDGTGFVKVFDFAGGENGSNPVGDLITDGTFLYGMTYLGGTSNLGTIFKIKPDGIGFVKLLDFAGATNGFYPKASLISDGIFLYGMTYGGGTNGFGTIFKIMPDGTGYTKLLDFDNVSNGRDPQGSLLSHGAFLYGMTYHGGINDRGTIFKIMPDGSAFNKLLDFSFATYGALPWGSLISDGASLYGMTEDGGVNAVGTIFKYSISAALPTITSFTPISGPIGTTVIITGTNFSSIAANNEIRFNGVFTYATLSSATSITTSVPSGALTGKITVTIGGNTATSGSDFTVTTAATISFSTQPLNQAICEGSNTTLSLVATGDTNLQYQWQIDNSGFTNLNDNLVYSGVNTSVLNLINPPVSLNGSVFRCLVYGDNSVSTASGSATLNINSIPVAAIAVNETQLTASSGDSYQWYQNGDLVDGATNQTFEFNTLEYGVYVVDVTDNGCTDISEEFIYLITGVEKMTEGLHIYPNPVVSGELFIISSENATIKMFDVLGRKVKEATVAQGLLPNIIPIYELNAGSYIIAIQSVTTTTHVKIKID